ncbi:MAG TPA: LptF/LptG family permease [Williamwhitmania sp.]|nr:LptF/LptG family permease [Williamwhitmania sp.]
MKKFHSYILKSFLGPMLMTFFIVMFILLMQFLWKYIDDLVGKGLTWDIIGELLLYASATLVPMALPLTVLLASIMTLGSLGENNELLAMKAAGISLRRILAPLIILIIVISGLGFLFSNNVLPVTNLKMKTLLYSVGQQRPELQIKEGVFTNSINGYSIKVGSKDRNSNLMRRIMIYNHANNEGNISVTTADSGYMRVTANKKFMVVELFHGNAYEEVRNTGRPRNAKANDYAFRRTFFKEETFILPLTGFDFKRTDEGLFKSNYQMLNLKQLAHAEDSLTDELSSRKKMVFRNMLGAGAFMGPIDTSGKLNNKYPYSVDSAMATLDLNEKKSSLNYALSMARSAKNNLATTKDEISYKQRVIYRHEIEWHRKFALSFACFVFFFIGAPLGAIIRKGGLGMPVVISVFFFVIYYIISITGEKFVREGMLPAIDGMWISSVILLPLGVFLSYKATTDSMLLNIDWYLQIIKKVRRFFGTKKKHSKG